jgi:hypothetical protein
MFTVKSLDDPNTPPLMNFMGLVFGLLLSMVPIFTQPNALSIYGKYLFVIYGLFSCGVVCVMTFVYLQYRSLWDKKRELENRNRARFLPNFLSRHLLMDDAPKPGLEEIMNRPDTFAAPIAAEDRYSLAPSSYYDDAMLPKKADGKGLTPDWNPRQGSDAAIRKPTQSIWTVMNAPSVGRSGLQPRNEEQYFDEYESDATESTKAPSTRNGENWMVPGIHPGSAYNSSSEAEGPFPTRSALKPIQPRPKSRVVPESREWKASRADSRPGMASNSSGMPIQRGPMNSKLPYDSVIVPEPEIRGISADVGRSSNYNSMHSSQFSILEEF